MRKWVTIGGGLAGALLVVILLSLFFWYRRSQSPKRVPRGNKTIWISGSHYVMLCIQLL